MSFGDPSSSSSSSSSSSNGELMFKFVVVGDSGVGKSNLVKRFVGDKFSATHETTIGVDFASRTMRVDEQQLAIYIWDTAGQERFRAIAGSYYRGAHAVIIVYDITNSRSYDNLGSWLREARANADGGGGGGGGGSSNGNGSGGAAGDDKPPVNLLLIGNKVDLASSGARQVAIDEAKAFAQKHDALFFETSARDMTGVDDAFIELVKVVYARHAAAVTLARTGKHVELGRSKTIVVRDVDRKRAEKRAREHQRQKAGCMGGACG